MAPAAKKDEAPKPPKGYEEHYKRKNHVEYLIGEKSDILSQIHVGAKQKLYEAAAKHGIDESGLTVEALRSENFRDVYISHALDLVEKMAMAKLGLDPKSKLGRSDLDDKLYRNQLVQMFSGHTRENLREWYDTWLKGLRSMDEFHSHDLLHKLKETEKYQKMVLELTQTTTDHLTPEVSQSILEYVGAYTHFDKNYAEHLSREKGIVSRLIDMHKREGKLDETRIKEFATLNEPVRKYLGPKLREHFKEKTKIGDKLAKPPEPKKK